MALTTSAGLVPAPVREPGQRVGLVHELAELGGAEELLQRGHDGTDVDDRLRRDRVDVLGRHPLAHDPLHAVEADPERFKPRKTPEQMAALEAGGFNFKDYEGMMVEMKKLTLVIDDISHHEMEKLIEIYKPDIIGSGIKDKFVIEKMGVPCKQLHSYDYSGPYAAFGGEINFYREVDRMHSDFRGQRRQDDHRQQRDGVRSFAIVAAAAAEERGPARQPWPAGFCRTHLGARQLAFAARLRDG